MSIKRATPEQRAAARARYARFAASRTPEQRAASAAKRRDKRQQVTAIRLSRLRKYQATCRSCGYPLTHTGGRGRPPEYCPRESPNYEICRELVRIETRLQVLFPRVRWYGDAKKSKLRHANKLNDVVKDNLNTGLF